MLWFNKKKKRRLEMMQQGINATSKTSLKLQCLFCAKGDLKEAKELYEFFASDMPNLPETDPVKPTVMENVKDNALGIYQFFKDNKDDIAQGIDFIRSILTRNGNVANDVMEALPPINNEQ